MAASGSCPDGGRTLAVESGRTVPHHRAPGEQKTCSGTGKTIYHLVSGLPFDTSW